MCFFTSVERVTRAATRAAFLGSAQLLQMLLMFVAFAAPSAFAQEMGNTLVTNQSLSVGQYLRSTNKQYKLAMQSDGNLALYREPSTYLWGTGATAGRRAVMQSDGNLCMYGSTGAGAWCNSSNGAEGAHYLMLRDSGVLEVYRGAPANSGASVLVWTTLLDAPYYNGRYADLKNAFNGDARRLMDHWVTYGRFEGRAPNTSVSDTGRQKAIAANLDTKFYANKYGDLRNAFGYDADGLYQHWMNFGIKEARIPNQPTEEWLAPAPRSANGRSSMRVEDWLHTNEYLRAPGGGYVAVLQNDNNFVIYQTGDPKNANAGNHRWNYNNNQSLGSSGPAVLRIQADGHFCVYKGSVNAQGQGVKCVPAGAGGPIGRYYLTLQDDGNLVIYKGSGPADSRGSIWDRITTAPSSGFSFSSITEAVSTFVVNTANTVANGTTGAANTVAAGSATAANDFAREAAAGAAATKAAADAAAAAVAAASKVALNATVNTANKVANDTTKVAVTVGRSVENGTQVVGKEIIKNGEIVGYAVANLAVDAWNLLKGNCGVIGRKVFAIDGYFQGYKRITDVVTTYGGFAPGSAELKKATDQANQCFDWAQDGFYCAFPAEIEKIVSQSASIPGNLLNLATRVFNEAKTEQCLIAGAATATFGAMGLQVCALGKVVVTDAEKAFACFSAAESKGVMKKFYTPLALAGERANPTTFPNQASCHGIGELAFVVAETIVTNGLSNEAKAAKAAGKSNTVAIVADQLRTVYKVASAGADYNKIMAELETMPECK